ncbi:phage tail protein [Fuscibacter oryzae]|uniref:Phage tail protein n=1 Tax=Fuscibacter oryzae TaxID=2803939 RepID=A0A8J7MTG5_9RHOB|nr:phage tail protein [Fuscibacter oryzae]MBL4929317.1 phage tail protein [Fuscibacter oryzae]
MADVMMRLGTLKFGLRRAAYQELSRNSEWRWARQERIGTNDALQYTGIGADNVTLQGVVFPTFTGSVKNIDRMRTLATAALPLPLIDGLGKIWGLWVITSIGERQSVFAARGAPLRQEFDLSLTRFDAGLGGLRALLSF